MTDERDRIERLYQEMCRLYAVSLDSHSPEYEVLWQEYTRLKGKQGGIIGH